MEAPNKLYVDTNDNLSDSILYGFTEKRKDDDIEYTRTDAFIEKACKFLFDNYHGEKLSLKMIENFKKYMEGE